MEKIYIRPKGGGYLFVCIIVWIIIIVFIFVSFLVLIVEKQYVVFFIALLPFDFLMCFFFTKIMLYKVSFVGNKFIAPRVYQIQEEEIEVECDQILSCQLGFEKFYFYFLFNCIDKKTYKMFISRYSQKQLIRILERIKERGGLKEQDINEIEFKLTNSKKI